MVSEIRNTKDLSNSCNSLLIHHIGNYYIYSKKGLKDPKPILMFYFTPIDGVVFIFYLMD